MTELADSGIVQVAETVAAYPYILIATAEALAEHDFEPIPTDLPVTRTDMDDLVLTNKDCLREVEIFRSDVDYSIHLVALVGGDIICDVHLNDCNARVHVVTDWIMRAFEDFEATGIYERLQQPHTGQE